MLNSSCAHFEETWRSQSPAHHCCRHDHHWRRLLRCSRCSHWNRGAHGRAGGRAVRMPLLAPPAGPPRGTGPVHSPTLFANGRGRESCWEGKAVQVQWDASSNAATSSAPAECLSPPGAGNLSALPARGEGSAEYCCCRLQSSGCLLADLVQRKASCLPPE